jgi:hypothetical protein
MLYDQEEGIDDDVAVEGGKGVARVVGDPERQLRAQNIRYLCSVYLCIYMSIYVSVTVCVGRRSAGRR